MRAVRRGLGPLASISSQRGILSIAPTTTSCARPHRARKAWWHQPCSRLSCAARSSVSRNRSPVGHPSSRTTATDALHGGGSAGFEHNRRETSTIAMASKHRTKEPTVHWILSETPLGSLTPDILRRARNIIVDRCKHRNDFAEMAEAILKRIEREEDEGRNPDAHVDSMLYNICIGAWAKTRAKPGDCPSPALRAESILNQMEERCSRRMKEGVDISRLARPDSYSYNSVLRAWSLSTEEDSAEKAEETLSRMERMADSHDPIFANVIPTALSYNTVIDAFANRREYGSAQRAEDHLLRMSELHANGNEYVRPTTTSFNTVMKAWGTNGGWESANRAEAILRSMIKLHHDGHDDVKPDPVSFSTVISAYSGVKGDEAFSRVEEILNLMEEEDIASRSQVTSCYNAALNVLAKSGLNDTGVKADAMFELMVAKGPSAAADVITYTSLIEAHLKGGKGGPDAIDRAVEILHEMIDTPGIKPNKITFNLIIDGLRNSGQPDGPQRSEDLLNLMCEIGVAPDTSTFSMIIDAYFRSEKKGSTRKVLDIFNRMEQSYLSGNDAAKPCSYCYNAVISKWSRCTEPEAENIVHKMLSKMESQYEDGNLDVGPDTLTYNLALKASAKANRAESAERAERLLRKMKGGNSMTDTVSYTTVINAFQNAGHRRAVRVAVGLLEEMENIGSGDIHLDTLVYKVVLNTLANSRDPTSGPEAMTILTKMMELSESRSHIQIDSSCCNAVIRSCAIDQDPRNHFLLQSLTKMVKNYREGKLKVLPNTIGFNQVIRTMAKSDKGNPDHPFQMLKLMKELNKSGVEYVKPDAVTYTACMTAKRFRKGGVEQVLKLLKQIESENLVDATLMNAAINAIARSDEPGVSKADNARRLLDKMAVEYQQNGVGRLQPTPYSYNGVLAACAFTKGDAKDKSAAFKIAQKTFFEALHSNKIDHVTFGMMIKCCSKLIGNSDERMRMIGPVLQDCTERGYFGDFVTKEVRYSLSKEQQNQLLGRNDLRDLPHQWTRNVDRPRRSSQVD